MRILLIAGGWSPEREVSLNGARSIRTALEGLGHAVTLFDPANSVADLPNACKNQDFAFINLHGKPGEDGLIQAMLDRLHLPYQGSDAAGSFLALDKAATKTLLRHAGLPTADWVFLPQRPVVGWLPPFAFPVFIKSNIGGSSLHLAHVEHKKQLAATIKRLFQDASALLVEPALSGVEVTCAVLDETPLPPILIRPNKSDYFDYTSKYATDGAEEICPAPISEELTKKAQEYALAVHKLLGLSGYSRTDFVLTDKEELIILEVNTLPGMTATSLIPKACNAAGMSFESLLTRLIELGIERSKQ